MRQQNGGEKGQKEREREGQGKTDSRSKDRKIGGEEQRRKRGRTSEAKESRRTRQLPRYRQAGRRNQVWEDPRRSAKQPVPWGRETWGCPTPTTMTTTTTVAKVANNNALVNVHLSGLAKTPALFIVHSLPLCVILLALSPLIRTCIWHPSVNACVHRICQVKIRV